MNLEEILKPIKPLSESLSTFLPRFFGILTEPRRTFRAALNSAHENGQQFPLDAVLFGLTSLALSAALAAAWHIPGKPILIDAQFVLAAFFVWVFVSIPLHVGLKLIGGRGTLSGTVAAVIYSTGTIQLAFIPIVGALAHFTTETRVILTYPYLISYGYGDWRNIYFSWPFSDVDRRTQESFIRENEPDRERTVLVPISTLEAPPKIENGRGPADFNPFALRSKQRIPIEKSSYEKPSKSLTAEIRSGLEGLWLGFAASYFVSMYFYLASTLSVVHQRNPILLFLIALLGPPAAFVAVAALFYVAVGLFR